MLKIDILLKVSPVNVFLDMLISEGNVNSSQPDVLQQSNGMVLNAFAKTAITEIRTGSVLESHNVDRMKCGK